MWRGLYCGGANQAPFHIYLVVLEWDLAHGRHMFLKSEASEAEKLRVCNGPDFFQHAHSTCLQRRMTSGVHQQPVVVGPWLSPLSTHRQCSSSASTAWWNMVWNSEYMDVGK